MPRVELNSYLLPVKVDANLYGDLALVCVVHANANPAYGEVIAVNRAGQQTVIGRTDALGKDDSVSAVAYSDGTVRLFASEADLVPNSSGSTSKLVYYDFPNALPIINISDITLKVRVDALYLELQQLKANLLKAGNELL